MNKDYIYYEELEFIGLRHNPYLFCLDSLLHYQGTPCTGWVLDRAEQKFYLLCQGFVTEGMSVEGYKARVSKLGRLLHE